MMASQSAAATAPRVFRKMHGLGNDFVLLDLRPPGSSLPDPAWVRSIADRKTGIGFDQLVGILPGGNGADAELRFWNADGGEAGACGNGTRCAADLLLQERQRIALRTRAGLLHAGRIPGSDDIAVDLGPPHLAWQEIPLAAACDTSAFPAPAGAAGLVDRASAVGLGNPHCVLLVADAEQAPVATAGPAVERDPLFPEGANVSFAEIRAPDHIRLRVWERGVGETRACGSAACATLVALRRLGLVGATARIELDGGDLTVRWPGRSGGVLLRGPVCPVFEGVLFEDAPAPALGQPAAGGPA